MTEKEIQNKLVRLGKACSNDLPNNQLKSDFEFIWNILIQDLSNKLWQLSKK